MHNTAFITVDADIPDKTMPTDGTCEGDSPNLFCGLDGISELVLDTVKIPSEKKELLIPFFERIKEQYGEPLALVHDMGKGIVTAVEEVFPGVADFICHFHFLRDIGKDLLLNDYTILQKRLRKFKVRPLLRQRSRHLEQKSQIDTHLVKIELENAQNSKEKILPEIRKLIRDSELTTKISALFLSTKAK